ncbi:MAG: hypothetical protein BGO52_11825 [Sphingobacteriales bacterium 44-61]|nr:MAG: hypothetical protein BGO52_11825 [Sphingobacteriales bacterium 44-61]
MENNPIIENFRLMGLTKTEYFKEKQKKLAIMMKALHWFFAILVLFLLPRNYSMRYTCGHHD